MRAFVGAAAVMAVAAGFALLAPVPGVAQDYSYGYQAQQAERDGSREDWGNAPYNAYNSWDGYARSHRGYWERPSDRYRGSCGGYRCYRGAYNGYSGYGGGGGYGADGAWYYPGYGYGSANTPSPAFPAGGYGAQGAGGRDPQRSQWCASRYRSYDWRSGTFVGYDGWRHYCG